MITFIEYFIDSPNNDFETCFAEYLEQVFCKTDSTERHKLKENKLWEEIYTSLVSNDKEAHKLSLSILKSSDIYQHSDIIKQVTNDTSLNCVFNSIMINEYNL